MQDESWMQNAYLANSRFFKIVVQLTAKTSARLGFRDLIIKRGYSERAVDELWKWYDFSEKKGVASF
jgi:hypothetical protein